MSCHCASFRAQRANDEVTHSLKGHDSVHALTSTQPFSLFKGKFLSTVNDFKVDTIYSWPKVFRRMILISCLNTYHFFYYGALIVTYMIKMLRPSFKKSTIENTCFSCGFPYQYDFESRNFDQQLQLNHTLRQP